MNDGDVHCRQPGTYLALFIVMSVSFSSDGGGMNMPNLGSYVCAEFIVCLTDYVPYHVGEHTGIENLSYVCVECKLNKTKKKLHMLILPVDCCIAFSQTYECTITLVFCNLQNVCVNMSVRT